MVIPGGRLVIEGGMPDELGTGELTGTEVDDFGVGTDTGIEEKGTDELGAIEELGTTDELWMGTETEIEE